MSVATEQHVVGCQHPVEEGSSEDGGAGFIRPYSREDCPAGCT